MVPFLNVMVKVAPLTQTKLGDNSLDNPAIGDFVTGLTGFLDMMTPDEAFMTYNVQLMNPAIIHVELTDEFAFTPDSQMVVTSNAQGDTSYFDGFVFRVHGRADIRNEGLDLDHASFILDRRTYPFAVAP